MRRAPACLLVAALVVLPGCAAGDDSDVATTSSPSPSATSTSASPTVTSASPSPTEESAEEITVTITDGKVRPKPRRVEIEQDSTVRLLVTSDVRDELHVHGYDLEEPLRAGRETTLEFVADESGIFEVETHDSGLTLLQLEVR
jgi:hypothetical protein